MKASSLRAAAQGHWSGGIPSEHAASGDGLELSLLEESLTKTVWERMLANDDALRFAELLQAAMLKTRAKS